MPKINLHNLVMSPVARMILFFLFLIAIVAIFFAVHNRKEEIRDKAAVLHQAKEYTYEAPIQEYREQQKPKTLKMIEMTPENNSEKQAESPEFPKMDFARPEPPVPQRGNSDQRRSIERRPAIPRGSIQQPKVLRPVILPINLYTKTDQASTVVPDDKDIAPYGRLLRCELVGTISTGSLQTPIRALVTESLWWNGVEIIPAGVELHGMVSGSPSRDRIGTSSSWIAVYPFLDERSAYQMQLTGIALDCNRTETSWGESDGTAGIRGRVVSNADTARVMGYIASFISGMGSGLVTETDRYIGNTTQITTGGTWKDALGKALAKSAEKIATDMLREASRDVYYVVAEAGTEFYIYVQEIIDPSKAARGRMENTVTSVSNTKMTRPNREVRR